MHQMAFSAGYNMLAWTDSSGNFMRWRDLIPSTMPSPIKPAPATGMTAPMRRQAIPLFGDEDGGDDTAIVNDDVAGGDADAEERDDDWIIDDLGGEAMQDKTDRDRQGLREFGEGFAYKYRGLDLVFVVSVTKAQPPFQPGATPFQYKRRYLCKPIYLFSYYFLHGSIKLSTISESSKLLTKIHIISLTLSFMIRQPGKTTISRIITNMIWLR